MGKHKTAKVFAASLLTPPGCEDPAALARRVQHEVHPDLVMIEPESKQLLIDQVRGLVHELSTKPVEAERKVAIIDDADTMNAAAANALLKTLEEPPGQTVLVLVSCEPERLLPTIISRCYQVRFRPLRPEEIKAYLVEVEGQDEEMADLLTRVSGGIFGKAVTYLKDSKRLEHWREAVGMARRLGSASILEAMDMAKRIVDMVESEVKDYKQQGDEEVAALKGVVDERALARLEKYRKGRQAREALKERQQAFTDIFEGLASWYRDILIYSLALEGDEDTAGIELVNQEFRPEIHEMAHLLNVERVMEAVWGCEEARLKLSRNAGALLLTENLMLKLEEISSGASRMA